MEQRFNRRALLYSVDGAREKRTQNQACLRRQHRQICLTNAASPYLVCAVFL